ncbi:MAG: zf-TFIIB domain-containing protein, partial [Sandaracinaceae bacterium]|nr:zf-TFIIB domain-containing protein [Sandaracinaceae bacterium]
TATDPGSRLALGCARCGGLWARDGAIDKLAPAEPAATAARAPNDERTGLCPDGHGILLRARVEQQDEPPFYLERCAHCHGVWFDAGEWARVASSELRTHLDDLWDPVARLEALRAKREARLTGDLRARLGDALHDQLVAVVEALASHPDRAMALAFVEQRLARPST